MIKTEERVDFIELPLFLIPSPEEFDRFKIRKIDKLSEYITNKAVGDNDKVDNIIEEILTIEDFGANEIQEDYQLPKRPKSQTRSRDVRKARKRTLELKYSPKSRPIGYLRGYQSSYSNPSSSHGHHNEESNIDPEEQNQRPKSGSLALNEEDILDQIESVMNSPISTPSHELAEEPDDPFDDRFDPRISSSFDHDLDFELFSETPLKSVKGDIRKEVRSYLRVQNKKTKRIKKREKMLKKKLMNQVFGGDEISQTSTESNSLNSTKKKGRTKPVGGGGVLNDINKVISFLQTRVHEIEKHNEGEREKTIKREERQGSMLREKISKKFVLRDIYPINVKKIVQGSERVKAGKHSCAVSMVNTPVNSRPTSSSKKKDILKKKKKKKKKKTGKKRKKRKSSKKH